MYSSFAPIATKLRPLLRAFGTERTATAATTPGTLRSTVLVVAGALLFTGAAAGERPTPGILLARPGPDVRLVMGTSDYSPGTIRVSFLVVDEQGRSILRPLARIWVARGIGTPIVERATATLENVGPPHAAADPGDVTRLYVAHVHVPRPGDYVVVAEPVGGRRIQGLGNLRVRPHTRAPSVGERAYPSATPTLRSTHGRVSELTTADPPDRRLLVYSVKDALRAHDPFVLVFATPKFCQSRTCGPVVGVVETVAREFAPSGVRFIHLEIYRDNDPTKGPNRFTREWRLPSEPFTFLVGRDGRIKAAFEGSFSARELQAAVRRYLL